MPTAWPCSTARFPARCSRSSNSTPSPTACTRPPGSPSRCSRCSTSTFPRGGATISTCATPSTCPRPGIVAAHAPRQGRAAGRSRFAHRPGAQSQGAHAGFCPPRRHLQARRPAVHRSRAPGSRSPPRPADCRFSMPARPIPRTSPARRSSSSVVEEAAKLLERHAAHRLPRKLRLGSGRHAHRRRRCMGEHPAPALRGLRHQRHEGRPERRPQPLDSGWMVDRGLHRRRHRMGHRRRRQRRRRSAVALPQAGNRRRAALPRVPRKSGRA